MALCSLSIGRISAPLWFAASINKAPDMTNASLLASKTLLPAFTAASVGKSPAAPTMAAITASTSGALDTSSSALAPARISASTPYWDANSQASL